MKALVYNGPRDVQVKDMPDAKIERPTDALVRITRMCLRHPWQVAIAVVSTFVAATLQLFIPRLLGHAVDQAQGILANGATS